MKGALCQHDSHSRGYGTPTRALWVVEGMVLATTPNGHRFQVCSVHIAWAARELRCGAVMLMHI